MIHSLFTLNAELLPTLLIFPKDSRLGKIQHLQWFVPDEELKDLGNLQGLSKKHQTAMVKSTALDLRFSPF